MGLEPLTEERREALDEAVQAFKQKILTSSRSSAQVDISVKVLDKPDVKDMDHWDRWVLHDSVHADEPL